MVPAAAHRVRAHWHALHVLAVVGLLADGHVDVAAHVVREMRLASLGQADLADGRAPVRLVEHLLLSLFDHAELVADLVDVPEADPLGVAAPVAVGVEALVLLLGDVRAGALHAGCGAVEQQIPLHVLVVLQAVARPVLRDAGVLPVLAAESRVTHHQLVRRLPVLRGANVLPQRPDLRLDRGGLRRVRREKAPHHAEPQAAPVVDCDARQQRRVFVVDEDGEEGVHFHHAEAPQFEGLFRRELHPLAVLHLAGRRPGVR